MDKATLPDLSVIICVYNTSMALLSACLASVRRELLSSYEIILVDDGSTKDYRELANKFNARYEKRKRSGILLSRLYGIKKAKGRYVTFVDSDDTVSFYYHEPMIKHADATDADIVIGDWAFQTDHTRYAPRYDSTLAEDILAEGEEVLLRFLKDEGREHSLYVLWNKIYRRRTIRRAFSEAIRSIRRAEDFSYSEDALINFFAFKYANMLINVHTGYYFYRLHPTQTVSIQSRDKLEAHIRCMATTLAIMRQCVKKSGNCSLYLPKIQAWCELMARTHYSYAKSCGYPELFPLIRDRYGIDTLSPPRLIDGKAYRSSILLPDNLEEIDRVLLSRIAEEKPIALQSQPMTPYTRRVIDALAFWGFPIFTVHSGGCSLPRPRYRLTSRMLHNTAIRSVGMLLFRKGSRIRAFLKRFF